MIYLLVRIGTSSSLTISGFNETSWLQQRIYPDAACLLQESWMGPVQQCEMAKLKPWVHLFAVYGGIWHLSILLVGVVEEKLDALAGDKSFSSRGMAHQL